MPCFFPLQARILLEDGKKNIVFPKSDYLFHAWKAGIKFDNTLMLPCGRCLGCRLERSRQWAIRIMHEASLYEANSFLTLTFNNEYLNKMCLGGSLSKEHVPLFLKRLRRSIEPEKVRSFYCGEYGEKFSRPHYHVLLFGYDFPDKVLWKVQGGFSYYTSAALSRLWPFGFVAIGGVDFDSAAYVARYCVKKVTGKDAVDHYAGRLPEFCNCSRRPGIATAWLEQFGESDVFAHDEVVVRGFKCKPPRFYDKFLERIDPVRFANVKALRAERASLKADDNSFSRLQDRLKCAEARYARLERSFEKENSMENVI